MDIEIAHGAPNPDRVGCYSEAELIEFANAAVRLTTLASTTS